MKGLTDKVAIVTGGASGIGEATVKRLRDEGVFVVIADVDAANGERVANETGALFRCADVSSLDAWHELTACAVDNFGRLDFVHNNAYATFGGDTHDVDVADWHRTLDVTLLPLFLSVKACIPEIRRRRGAIVTTSSIHSVMGFAGSAAYDAAKAGINGLTRELATEYAPEVRFNAVLPGAIRTPAWESIGEEFAREFEGLAPAGRLGEPSEVAAAVAFLLSDEASFITGTTLLVDGGFTITKGPRH